MQVSVENTSALGRRLIVNVPAEKLQLEEQGKIAKYAKDMRISGFRKGKVPATVVKQRYGEQVHKEVVLAVLESGLKDALDKEDLHPVGRPEVEEIKDNKGEDLQFTVSFEVFPQITLKDFSSLELEKTVVEITDADVAQTIDSLCEQYASWEAVERAAETGDKVEIDFVGKIDGEAFEHGSATDFDLEIGSNRFIPGFEDGLVGALPGETRDVNVTFPAEYGEKKLAGKDAVFTTTVKKVLAKKLATVDAEFAKKIGITDGDVAQVSAKVRENMLKQIDKMVSNTLRSDALEALLKAHDVELPQILVKQEQKALAEEAKRKHNADLTSEEDQAKLKEDAEKRTALAILLREIIKQHNLSPEQDRVRQKIQEIAATFGNIELVSKIYTENKELYAGIQDTVLTEQVADLIATGATIKEKQQTFNEFTGKPKQGA